MDKAKILSTMLEELKAEIKRCQLANKSASSGATDSEARAESKWDTQGLEASYLARGYAQQYELLQSQAKTLASFDPASYDGKPVGVGALVKCEIQDFTEWYFLLPCCGGMELCIDDAEVTIITPESPLGLVLTGKKTRDNYTLPNGEQARVLEVE